MITKIAPMTLRVTKDDITLRLQLKEGHSLHAALLYCMHHYGWYFNEYSMNIKHFKDSYHITVKLDYEHI